MRVRVEIIGHMILLVGNLCFNYPARVGYCGGFIQVATDWPLLEGIGGGGSTTPVVSGYRCRGSTIELPMFLLLCVFFCDECIYAPHNG